MLDLDGTLAPFADTPAGVALPPATRAVLGALAARPSTHVAIVTGRAADDADRILGIPAAWIIGNHGCEILDPQRIRTIDPLAAPHRDAVARAGRTIRERVGTVPGIIIEDKTWTLSIHYRLADPSIAPWLRDELDAIAGREGLRRSDGKLLFEVRPNVRVNKGTAVVALAERVGATDDRSSVLFAGDDLTDEDAFSALRRRYQNSVTIRVSDSVMVESAAEFIAANPGALREFLASIPSPAVPRH